MWAVRRASASFRRGFMTRYERTLTTNIEISRRYAGSKICSFEYSEGMCSDLKKFHHPKNISQNISGGRRGLSSQAGEKSSGEDDDLEDGFSELETTSSIDADSDNANDNDNEFTSGPGLSEEDDAEDTEDAFQTELLDTESGLSGNRSQDRRVSLELIEAIISASPSTVQDVLDKWVEEGKDLGDSVIFSVINNLRKRRMYAKALQFSEWLESKKVVDFAERDYASRIDLIARVYGPQKAENYIEHRVGPSFRGALVYGTLLVNYVRTNDIKKAEEVFNKMKDLNFPISSFACNQLLLLYRKVNKKKIGDVLMLMEKENVKPTRFTYNILLDAKGLCNDISGMEQIFDTMKAEGIEPDTVTWGTVAKHYTTAGLKERAEAILKEMEGGNLKQNRPVCRRLLNLYAELGKADEVARVWKVCDENPQFQECMAAIEAWGKLKKVEEAEAIFKRMSKRWKLYPKNYSKLLKVYAANNMLEKGKDLIKRMADSGCRIGPLTWDALVKLYIQAGEVEKADSVLQKAAQKSKVNPLHGTYRALLEQYAKRGDVHNAEKIFFKMKETGYQTRFWQFQCLVQAYVNAKSPAYGMRDRMKAENLFPNRFLESQLILVDGFRKDAAAKDLLD